MPAFAITEKVSLQTLYVGIHATAHDAMYIYLGWPDEPEMRAAQLRLVCEEVDLYPKAQKCRL